MNNLNSQTKFGKRIVVTGMAGAGKSTFSKQLAAHTGLPLIHLDLHIWKPGWVRVSDEELFSKQKQLLAAEAWIIDGNDVDDDLLYHRADTLIVLATPWWICSWRAFKRGLWRRPPGGQLPEGCEESHVQRLLDEWGIVWRNFRRRKSVPQHDLEIAARCEKIMTVYVLRSKLEGRHLLSE